MKNRVLNKFISVVALCFVANASQAALIHTSVDLVHDYGNGVGKYSPNSLNSSNTCDTLNSNFVTVTDSSSCGRFYDYFDFSVADFASITSLELTLDFSGAGNGRFWSEDWNVRPGASASQGSGYDYGHDVNITSSVITFDASNLGSTIFANMLVNERFTLMFAEESWFNDNFELYSASLTVNGQTQEVVLPQSNPATKVPEPSMLALFGLGLLFISRVKLRKS